VSEGDDPIDEAESAADTGADEDGDAWPMLSALDLRVCLSDATAIVDTAERGGEAATR
jgi:hypothetical protein